MRTFAVVKRCAMVLCLGVVPFPGLPQSNPKGSTTQVVLLGTGTPGPDPDRSGPATAIVVNGTPYLVDLGPGVVRRASAAYLKGVKALKTDNLGVVFITHLHSDHTLGYPDLIFSPWVTGRKFPLAVYGPKGLKAMTEHLLAAYKDDIDVRTRGLEHLTASGLEVQTHEILPGTVYRDQNVKVTAFLVNHGSWPQAFGYRFDTPDRRIVISGDTSPAESIVENCDGCDVLLHEAYSQASFARVSPEWQKYRLSYHTSSEQLAEIARKARPGLLILYHRSNAGGGGTWTPEGELLEEVQRKYSGKVVTGHDLDIY